MIGAEKVATILLADDEPQIRDMLRALLSRQGYQVITAINGQDALEKFAESASEIDLVVTDIVMPEMDGVASYKEMKKINPALKVIYMSGFAENLPPDVHILLKPFPPVQLLHMIRTVLNNKHLDL
ncbi:response regulator [Geomonas paludis]|uniref:Response regulator n=1 Tax=Geomonas paludis TaxID=2740185 RepID=A0ABY4LJ14_9BACT|nr:response regulator [Geomonas paludis]UPU37829.1 response regulator [Geomonas paludis]